MRSATERVVAPLVEVEGEQAGIVDQPATVPIQRYGTAVIVPVEAHRRTEAQAHRRFIREWPVLPPARPGEQETRVIAGIGGIRFGAGLSVGRRELRGGP